ALFIIGHMGLFFYTKKGSIISTVDLPTTEIIEPKIVRQVFPHLSFFAVFRFAIKLFVKTLEIRYNRSVSKGSQKPI
ncbi:MAG: hypothetical protein MR834_01390, partial [Streptococcus alactolyticus]|uniref:hypothetical protein n=1 Tax=Streptococcus alactolyticus TaxID=29389 RepID=UPI00374F8895|nr:hypothetical protein [Streptococcus alactolyticus]